MTSGAEDLAARFEAEREKCEAFEREAVGLPAKKYWRGRADGWGLARDMARAGAAGGAGELENAAYDAEFAGDRLLRLKRAWANHVAPDAADHVWLLRMATKGVDARAAAPPPPDQQGSLSPLSPADLMGRRAQISFTCAARRQGTAGGNDPADCDWPVCGCDPYADKVVAALQESGHLVPASIATARDGGTGAGEAEARAAIEGLWSGREHEHVVRLRCWAGEILAQADRIEAALATISATDQDGEARRG